LLNVANTAFKWMLMIVRFAAIDVFLLIRRKPFQRKSSCFIDASEEKGGISQQYAVGFYFGI